MERILSANFEYSIHFQWHFDHPSLLCWKLEYLRRKDQSIENFMRYPPVFFLVLTDLILSKKKRLFSSFLHYQYLSKNLREFTILRISANNFYLSLKIFLSITFLILPHVLHFLCLQMFIIGSVDSLNGRCSSKSTPPF